MSGLEVVAVVAAIVSAFGSAGKLLIEWKNKRNKKKLLKKKEAEAAILEQSLSIGGSKVQSQYDASFAVLGAIFARGDGQSARTT